MMKRLILAVVAGLLWSAPARSAVAVDGPNVQIGFIGTATSYSNNFSFTVGASDNALLVYFWFETNPGVVVPPTWDGVSMTLINSFNNGTVFVYAFGLVSPHVGVHLTFAASWANSVPTGRGFFPASGADTSSFANAFKNYTSNSGANATSGQGVTITDASGSPTSNADTALTLQNGGSTGAVTTGQTDVGFDTGTAWNFDAAYGPGSASQNFGWTGNSAVSWFTVGGTIAAPGGAAAVIPIPIPIIQPFTHF